MASVQPARTSKDPASVGGRKHLKPIKTQLRLKKEDFRQCRLCMRVLPREDIQNAAAPGSDLQWKILDAVSVKITVFDKVTSVCTNCITMVDIINDFWMSCRKADTLHGTKLLMMHPGDWMNDENKRTLVECQQLTKRHRAEMDALFKCSGLDHGNIHWMTKGEEVLLEARNVPVKKVKHSNLAVKVVTPPTKEDEMGIETDGTVESDPEMSEKVGRQMDERVQEISRPNSKKYDKDFMCETEKIVENVPKISGQFERQLDAQDEVAQRLEWRKNAKDFMCDQCGKSMQKGYMEQHLNMHKGLKPYECTEEGCGRRFASAMLVNLHIRNFHRRLTKRFECEICHKLIRGGAFYRYHLQTHQANNARKFPCNVCGKMFYKNYLRDHMSTHTGEMPYKCEFCDRKFAARNNWATHRRKQHSEQLQNQG